MHIALFHPAKLPAKRYGGVERVTVWLARGLAELGHRVSLLAAPGSDVPETTLIPIDVNAAQKPAFDLRRHLPAGTEIIHAQRPIRALEDVPTVWTHHGNTRPDELDDLPPGMICLSANHATRHRTNAFVYNGLDPEEYRFSATKDSYDLFLGKLHPSKGYALAMEGAKRAGMRLIVAGGWRPSLRRDLKYVGEVGNEEKMSLLAAAQCLWAPAQWDEPFGLPLIEAMVSGTPVLGTLKGALPEIVTPDTGALGETLDDLVELRGRITAITPEACRARVERLFSHRTMAAEYVRCYEAVLQNGVLPAGRVGGM
ncbi:MAG TPA: glycosyltransferase [Gemmatimonadales bacterium]|nr:glycosyltransferase [Gemmatimonadales bacterium]